MCNSREDALEHDVGVELRLPEEHEIMARKCRCEARRPGIKRMEYGRRLPRVCEQSLSGLREQRNSLLRIDATLKEGT